jgi:hypothetical protein
MNPDEALASLLSKVNADALRGFDLPVVPDIEAVAVSGRHGMSRGHPGRPQTLDFLERLERSVREFSRGSEPRDFRTLRLLCHGSFHHIAPDDYVLAGDPAAVARLLRHVESYRHDPRRFRRLYDGLLRAYLSVDRQRPWFAAATVREGNEALRAFLASNFAVIRDIEPTPDWVLALTTYPEVISTDPGRRFADDWLTGGGKEFRNASERLALTGDSWLANQILESALTSACALDDEAFMTYIPTFLAAGAEPRFRSLRDDVYAALLTRYAAARSPRVHPTLRDALVHTWKNPWLARNDSAWARVSDRARRMVAGWLKLDLIHQFFDVLSDRAWQDTGRFQFWRAYHEQMDEVYFALSRAAFRSSDPDLKRFIAAADGLIFELTQGTSQNHAFIMCMKDVAVVEFSEKGNAAYLYARDALNLEPNRPSISIHELKKRPPGRRMIHGFAEGLTWQERFARDLGSGRIRSSAVSLATSMPARAAPWPASTATRGPAKPSRSSFQDIVAFTQGLGIAIEDHRSKGGSLWLRVDDSDPEISSKIVALGFRYRPGRGWWRAN